MINEKKWNEQMSAIRVLHVLDKISIDSGVSVFVMNYYEKINHDKLTFDFMLNEEPDASIRRKIELNGSKIFIMPSLKLKNIFKYINDLKVFYIKNKYKIIHGHVANSAVFYLGLAKNSRNKPFRIIHSHSVKSSDVLWKRIRNRFLIAAIKKVSDIRIACSKEAAEFLFGKDNNAIIINNAINIDNFIYNEELRTKIRISLGLEGKYVIGHVGRFSAVKNHEFLIDVFYEVHKTDANVKLLMIGGGELYENIVRKTKLLCLESDVIFLGVNDRVCDYMNAMDIFVLPSLFEGLGLAAVESQASGLETLVSDKVPRIVDVTGNVCFLRMEKRLWVDALLSKHKMGDREEQGKNMKSGIFDIDAQNDAMYELYVKLLKS